MDKEQIINGLKYIRENSSKRKFLQSVDLIINLKDIDLKKPEHIVNLFVPLHYSRGKKIKICALVGPELLEQAKSICDNAILVDNFTIYQEKKQAKKLAAEYGYFIAQATIMPKIASTFGRVFGPRGKMPNPKAGCVVPPNANLKGIYERLQNTIHLQTKNDPIIKCAVGNESMKDEEITDNIMTLYNGLVHALPNDKENIKSVYLKLTMGKSIKIDEKASVEGKENIKKTRKSPKEKKGIKQIEETNQADNLG